MPKHVKPTSEELEANTKKAAEELEAMDEESKEEVEEKEEEEETKEKETEKETEEKTEEKPEEKEEVEEVEEENLDYKKKFVESAREAQILHAKNKKINEALEKAVKSPEPEENELKKEYSDWDVMSDFEKKLARDNFRNTKRFQALEQIAVEGKNLEEWQTKVDGFIDDPKTLVDNPLLDGKQDDFKLFATKPTRRGLDFEDLVSAFLYNASKKPKSKKGGMFETGSGGTNVKSKSSKLSAKEAKTLRETDYGKYKELLLAGKLESGF